MNYVLERISTVQACDALLAGAKKKKQNLERRMRNLGAALNMFRKRLDQLHQEMAEVQSSLEAFAGAYGSLPQGKDKLNMKIRIKRLELQQAMLEKKATIYNVSALLIKEMQHHGLASQVTTLEDYVTAVEQRRAASEAPVLRIVQPAVLLRQPVARRAPAPQGKGTRPGTLGATFPALFKVGKAGSASYQRLLTDVYFVNSSRGKRGVRHGVGLLGGAYDAAIHPAHQVIARL